MTEKKRFYDIDWLRVIGMLLIFTFHTVRFFDYEDWHVKNLQLDFGASVYIAVLGQFIMPLFFVLSAIAIYFALQRRTGEEFMRERVNREIAIHRSVISSDRRRSARQRATRSAGCHSGCSIGERSRIVATAGRQPGTAQ